VLEKWDLHDNLDSRGALLFRRFASRALTNPVSSALSPPVSPFANPFDPADPVNTPNGLNTSSPQVRQALQDAVADLKGAGIPLDAPLRDWQYEKRGEEKIPISGGPGTVGVFNAINVSWDPKLGYPDVPHGSSYVQVVELPPGKCPDVHTILTYSQSTSPESPWFADQTRMFSKKQWVDMPFCPDELAKAPAVSELKFGGGVPIPGERAVAVRLLTAVKVRARGRVVVVTFRVLRRATVRVSVPGARAVTRRGVRPGRVQRVVLRRHGTARGAGATVTARAGKSRQSVTRASK
jgi:acyl-homoserine-lactone acylase